MIVSPEQRATELGLIIPDYTDPPYGHRHGSVKAFHRTGDFIQLGGMTAEDRVGNTLHPGIVGLDLTLEQGKEAAARTAVNCLGMIRLALGSLDRVASLASLQVFVAATSDFEDHHLVAEGASEVFVAVFGPDAGKVARATVGVTGLAGRNSVELLLSLEALPA